jgi:hypothetical protein
MSSGNDQQRLRWTFAAIVGLLVTPARVSLLLVGVCVFRLLTLLTLRFAWTMLLLLFLRFAWTMLLLLLVLVPILAGAHSLVALLVLALLSVLSSLSLLSIPVRIFLFTRHTFPLGWILTHDFSLRVFALSNLDGRLTAMCQYLPNG